MNVNPAEKRPIPETTTSVAPQPMQQTTGPTPAHFYFTMEKVSNVKGSMTSRLHYKRLMGKFVDLVGDQ